MTNPAPDAGETAAFQDLMNEVMARAERFGHREHIHLTWLAVHRYGVHEAAPVIARGLDRVARDAGVPSKFHVTLSQAWVQLVAHHLHEEPDADFATFAARNPALLDKRLIARFYRAETLASPRARTTWTPPDRSPFPWQATDSY
jgi:hypothetical protein